ncbi:dTDP-4-dehydrorhamnose 3,5-epimerase family protein [Bradyrhizobium sp. CCGUVB14]|uniref:dTDP-4-dehydrorhamnose 3,5-epimerase family protein n=1 Tax=Bradyrhizobium sp. CCGUVB14 TaxID=2949628 RepID=UPI0035C06A35
MSLLRSKTIMCCRSKSTRCAACISRCRRMWELAGFAHGDCTLEPNTEVIYKVTDCNEPGCDQGLKWDDPALAVSWYVEPASVRLADKDRRRPALKDLAPAFILRGAGTGRGG